MRLVLNNVFLEHLIIDHLKKLNNIYEKYKKKIVIYI